MNLPNLITLLRILAVPAIIWFTLSGEAALAFGLFILAGISDALDGLLAKHLKAETALGAYLDPIADKALLVSLFITLGTQERLAAWLVILVVSRDILIVGAIVLARLLDAPLRIAPIFVSKLNTSLQIALVGTVLAEPVVDIEMADYILGLTLLSAATTVVSGFAYLQLWVQAISGTNGSPPAATP